MPPEVRYGNYVLERRLAVGITGDLFVGHLIADGRRGERIVLKRLHGDAAAPDGLVARLVAEARRAADSEHPNVVQVREILEADGRPWLVFEYVEGIALGDLMAMCRAEDEAMPPRLCAHLAAEIAEALHHLHASAAHPDDTVHRDISPQSIVITPDGKVKLIDFGSAEGHDTGLVVPLGARPEVAYMSPEQAAGGSPDARSDVFSIGSLFYELLTGQGAFTGGSPEVTLAALRRAAYRPPEDLRPDLPAYARSILDRAMCADPGKRFASAHELANTLREFAGDTDEAETSYFVVQVLGDRDPLSALDSYVTASDVLTAAVSGSLAAPGTPVDATTRQALLYRAAAARQDPSPASPRGEAAAARRETEPDPPRGPRDTDRSPPTAGPRDTDPEAAELSDTVATFPPGLDWDPTARPSATFGAGLPLDLALQGVVLDASFEPGDTTEEMPAAESDWSGVTTENEAPPLAQGPVVVPGPPAAASAAAVPRQRTPKQAATQRPPATTPAQVNPAAPPRQRTPATPRQRTPAARRARRLGQPAQSPHRRLAIFASAGVVVAIAAGLGLWWSQRGPTAEPIQAPPPDPLAQVVAPAGPEPAVAPAPPPAAGEEYAPGRGGLYILTDPPTLVVIDGKRSGTTPVRITDLPAGPILLKLENPTLGIDRMLKAEVAAGTTSEVSIVLRKGRLSLDVRPWAHVHIDGKLIGTTPMTPVALYEGAHSVRLLNPDLEVRRELKVRIQAERTTELNENLEAGE